MRNSPTWENIKYRFQGNNFLFKIIIINVVVFVIIGFINVIYSLFDLPRISYDKILNFLSLSATPKEVIYKPWTIITYMFIHDGFFHILFNMLWLYWLGKIFLEYLNLKQFSSTYFLSGISGGILYLLAYRFIPVLFNNQPMNGLVGASAGVIGIVIATATLLPNSTIPLFFIGPVKLKYLALASLALFILGLGGTNAGGHFAHLGGALYGFIFIKRLQKGHDTGVWFNKLIDGIRGAFTTNHMKAESMKYKDVKNSRKKKRAKETVKANTPPRSAFNNPFKADQEEIDKILDKIAQSGYESLSDKEKDTLFNASKK